MTRKDKCKRCGKSRESVVILIPYKGKFLCDECVLETNRLILLDSEAADETQSNLDSHTDPDEPEEEIEEDIMAWSPLHPIDDEAIERIISTVNKNNLFERKDLSSEQIDPEAVALLPKEVAEQFCMIPLRREGKELLMAFSDPTDEEALREAKHFTGMSVNVVAADQDEIEAAIDKYYEA